MREPVENEDVATFTATFASGAVGTFSVSRVAPGCRTRSASRSSATDGAAAFDLDRPGEFSFADRVADRGRRTATARSSLGPEHPYIDRGLPMDFPGVGYGQNDLFACQARAFLDRSPASTGCRRSPSFAARPPQHASCLAAGHRRSAAERRPRPSRRHALHHLATTKDTP